MKIQTKTALLAASLFVLANCSQETNVVGAFNSEAGSFLDMGDYGNATMNNTQIQSGQKSYAIDLN